MKYFTESLIIAVIITALTYIIGYFTGWVTDLNWLEIFAVFTSYSCTWLCSRQSRINYPVGVITTAAYSLLFYQSGMPALAIFNLYLVFSLAYGWFRWGKDTETRPVTSINIAGWVFYTLFAAAIAILFVGINYCFDTTSLQNINSLDLLLAALSGSAQLMLDNKKLENWIVWAVINIISIPFFFASGLFLVAFQYVFFLVNTAIGYILWRNSRGQTSA